jgi:hypothetical protein
LKREKNKLILNSFFVPNKRNLKILSFLTCFHFEDGREICFQKKALKQAHAKPVHEKEA